MVYGIFSGAYSDWDVHGYFKSKDDAEKYCAVKNKKIKDAWADDFYVMEIKELTGDFKDIKLRYYHEVVFDFGRAERKNGMRNEPDRYEYYTGEKRNPELRFEGSYNWIAFKFECETREKAEKIAQDNFYNFLNCYKLTQDYAEAAKMVANNFIGEEVK